MDASAMRCEAALQRSLPDEAPSIVARALAENSKRIRRANCYAERARWPHNLGSAGNAFSSCAGR